jgi:hypothetical protein
MESQPTDTMVADARRLMIEQASEAERLAEERETRARDLAEQREQRARALEREESDRRTALAVARAKLDSDFEHKIDDAHKRIDVISDGFKEQVASLIRVENKQDEIIAKQALNEAVTKALTEQMEKWNVSQAEAQEKVLKAQQASTENQATRKQVKWAIIAVVVSMIGVTIAMLALVLSHA